MKIIRDGKEYELTFSEMMQAHEEYELDCMIEDVRGVYEQSDCNVDLSEEQIKEIASEALRTLSKNDSYYESYWLSVEYTFDNYIDKLPVTEEDDE